MIKGSGLEKVLELAGGMSRFPLAPVIFGWACYVATGLYKASPSGPFEYTVVGISALPDCRFKYSLGLFVLLFCDGKKPTAEEAARMKFVVNEILVFCPELSDAWRRPRQNIRFFSTSDPRYKAMGKTFDGVAPVGGDWALLSLEGFAREPLLIMAHELLHLYGASHDPRDPRAANEFRVREKVCSGGKSSYYRK